MKKQREDKAFRKFISSYPSILTGESPTVPAHVRRIRFGAGIAIKPSYYAVPLTNDQHLYQHQHGELACLRKYMSSREWTLEEAKEFFEEQAIKFNEIWFEGLLMA